MVTVLFADLSGFTALAETVDAEELRALQTELFALMAATIRRFDGFVEKFVGDAVMAVFGAPVAHEEDPERALNAALLLHRQAGALSGRWAARLGRPLALHIGVHTGPVVAGQLGSKDDGAYAVTGDTVNAAARLQGAADAGQTLVSRTTWQLTQHAFDFEPVGELALKGMAQPMAAWRLGAALSAPRPTRGLQAHGLASALIGRGAELQLLHERFDQVRAGHSNLLRIVAEAGTGKTRLLSEFLEQLAAQGRLEGVAMRRAACSSLGERAYGVPAALLRDAYGVSAQDAPDVARQKVAAGLTVLGAQAAETQQLSAFLGYVLGLEAEDVHTRYLDPEQLKQQIFAAVYAVVERRLQQGAVMMIVEDLHWTDAASLELLHFLLERLRERPFMLLVTQRPAPALEAWAEAAAAQTVLRLEPLSARCSEAMLDALFGSSQGALPAALRRRIVEHAGGNPLFLEEMARALIADGLLSHGAEGWTCSPRATAAQVPSTIHGLLLGRIDRLPAPARLALREAAVIGPNFAEALLRTVASAAPALPEALDGLVDAGLLAVVPASDGREFRFRHGLFQEVAYQSLLLRRRTELHTRIGQALEAQCGGAPRQLEALQALAHHFRLGADKARGAHYLVAAGDWARGAYANADAIRDYQLALDTLEACEGTQDQRLDVRERLGDVLAPAGRIAEATRHLGAAREGRSHSGDRVAEARLLRKLSALRWESGERAEAQQCLATGLALMDGAAPHIERAWLYQKMGELHFRNADNHGALDWTGRALGHLEALEAQQPADEEEHRNLRAAVALSLNIQGVALARLDRLDEAVDRLERSVAVARAVDLPQAECRALSNLGVLYSSSAPQRAIEACERGLQTARRIGDLGLQSRLSANLAVAYCTLTNRCDERGVDAANTAIRIDRSTGQLDHLAVSLVVLAQIYQCHGESARALRHYQEALALAETSAEPQLLFPCYEGLATLYLDVDDGVQAERYMALAQDTCERAGLDPDALVVLPFLC
ncbi:adenylate/guanylate cyclase domain-containing protein [Variovorax sp. J22G21]|uniref:ATP-binding protein n=1 Tax=Variovorax fucosicus TaxID=3053517 RepID=UPI002575CDEB|nr:MULTISPECIES: adenylate/guanylate cyclase domain-containing protein [unclassified Variovorax]MDM0042271.1 adenylate/guanylate cyclase domain-containing protein [Variovorax sp. J22R193]MDM0060875.1 adenylate/guanylate cyclase domain-containing protein [Variovorax sp. J22G21]